MNIFILVAVLPFLCVSASINRDYTYIRDLWTRADDITPSYDLHSLEEQWKKIDSRFHSLSGQLYDLGIEMFTRTNIEMPVLSSRCKKNLFEVFASVMRLEPWAYMMVASSGIFPNGFGSGVTYGSYDVCISVKSKKKFVGQYCTLELTFPFPKIGAYIARPKNIPVPKNFTVPNSIMDLLVTTLAPYYYFAFVILSVCMPSSCSTQDLQEIANTVVDIIDINATARVVGCQVKEPIQFNTADAVAMCVLCVAIFACILGSIAHVFYKKKNDEKKAGMITRILFCFSISTNSKRLFEAEENNILRVFSGMKVLTLLWLIIFHSHWFIPLNLYGSVAPVEVPYVPFNFETVRNGFLGFDTLFFIGAALLMYQRMKDSNDKFSVPQYVTAKVLSLAPGIMFVTAAAILTRHISNGPLWREIVNPISRRCETNWWTNLLFVNNYISSSEQCLIWSWYTATEMQLFLMSLLVLIPIKKKPKLGIYILFAAFVIGVVASIANHIGYDLPPTVVLSALFYPDDIIYFLDHGLFPSYLHLTSYSIGLAVGYILYKRPHMKFSRCTNTIAYFISCSVGFSIICCVHSWNIGHPPPAVVLSTLYSVLGKVVWCVALGWITVTCVTANRGIIHSMLTWKGFVPLGRLTYITYLLHPLIILIYVGSIRFPIQADGKTLTFLGFGLVLGTLIAAYIFHILFEAPFLALAQLFLNTDSQEEPMEIISDKKPKSIQKNGTVVNSTEKNAFNEKGNTNSVC